MSNPNITFRMTFLRKGMVVLFSSSNAPSYPVKIIEVKCKSGSHGDVQYHAFGTNLLTGEKAMNIFLESSPIHKVDVSLSSNNLGIGMNENRTLTYCDLSSGDYHSDLYVDMDRFPDVNPEDCGVVVQTLKWMDGRNLKTHRSIVSLE